MTLKQVAAYTSGTGCGIALGIVYADAHHRFIWFVPLVLIMLAYVLERYAEVKQRDAEANDG